MKSSIKKVALVWILASVFLLSSCWEKYDSNDYKNTTTVKKVENTVVENVVNEEVIDISDKDEKFKKTMDEVHAMKQGAMSKIKKLYTDLKFIKLVKKWDNSNLVWMWAEDWLYSKKYDVTVVVCNSMNTPAFVFNGKILEWEELEKVKVDMKEMMKMMEDGEMMDMWEHNSMGDMSNHMWNKDSMKKSEEKSEKLEEKNIVSRWIYTEYSASKLAEAKWNIVLFFGATWCPSCVSADKTLKSETIPEWLTVLHLDYDSNQKLKEKYEILSQHSFVQVDSKWNMVKKWSGSRNIASIVKKLK